jgi:hypothetical protein
MSPTSPYLVPESQGCDAETLPETCRYRNSRAKSQVKPGPPQTRDVMRVIDDGVERYG